MSVTLTIAQAGPALAVQDLGRPGWRAQGLTKGGAADPMAYMKGRRCWDNRPNWQ